MEYSLHGRKSPESGGSTPQACRARSVQATKHALGAGHSRGRPVMEDGYDPGSSLIGDPRPMHAAVIFSPHLDDAALSCWSVLSQPRPVTVLNFFSGAPTSGELGWWDRE